MSIDALIHIPNLMLLLSLAVRNVMLLRVFNLLASCFFVLYFAILPEPLMSALLWNILFGMMNVSRIWRIIADRRPPNLGITEQRVHRAGFPEMALWDFKRMMTLGGSRQLSPMTVLASAGELPTSIWVVSDIAPCEPTLHGTNGQILSVGDLLGAAEFFSEESLSEDIIVPVSCEVIELPVVRLRQLMHDQVQFGIAFQRILVRHLVSARNTHPPPMHEYPGSGALESANHTAYSGMR